ncbi:hypothetical protein STRIP9103_05155 [Streptomyces ipomoeae 91-03]|uniref:Uncharacterized protein n=1 Tax=Streptomyces ipomoeae 91-03 TaxID=698759 RepID=L1KKP9_9ACTN|nr:hypothetical protein STRIP9103_05155 [Streptomyces ipomoeae 91-03]
MKATSACRRGACRYPIALSPQHGGERAGGHRSETRPGEPLVKWSPRDRSAGHLLLGEVVATAGLVLLIFGPARTDRLRFARGRGGRAGAGGAHLPARPDGGRAVGSLTNTAQMAVIGCGGQSRLAAAGGPGVPEKARPPAPPGRRLHRPRPEGHVAAVDVAVEDHMGARNVLPPARSSMLPAPGPPPAPSPATARPPNAWNRPCRRPETGDRRPETAAAPACSTTPTPPGAATPAAADTVPAPIASRTPFTRPAPGLRRPPPISLVAC